MTEEAGTLKGSATPAAPARRRRRLPLWTWGALGAAAVLIYGMAVERMRLGPPLVMLALGGMMLAFAAAALWRVIDPLTRPQTANEEPAALSRGFTRELEREKQLVLKAIKEIELDYQMRKIAERDYREMVERYRNRAMRLISELDAGGDFRGLIEKELKLRLDLPPSEQPPAPSKAAAATPATARPICGTCKTENDLDAKFCKSCGAKF